MKETSVSLFKFMETMRVNGMHKFSENLSVGEMFYSPKDLNFTYIEPPFSIQYKTDASSDKFENVDIVLIAATGATGKSALSKYIACSLQQPIFDMGAAGPVGENSLLGMLNKNMEIGDTMTYLKDLKDGHALMIIDALDEGLLKVTSQAFESFLDEIVRLSNGAKGIPFVLTGRTHVMENVALELESKGMRVMLLQIEPFTIDKAKEFIDISMSKKGEQIRFQEMYIKVRDLILKSVEGFFQDIKEMKNKQYERFIGYAPVLQTIATLLDEKCNFQQLYQDLEKTDIKNIELVIDIIERILVREQQKVETELLPQIIQNIDPKTIGEIQGKVYGVNEQCVRLLYKLIGIDAEYLISNDTTFNERYEAKIGQWLEEHPFLNKDTNSFVNIVFETYVIARMLRYEKYKDAAMLFLQDKRYKTSYLLFDFYTIFSGDSSCMLDAGLLPYLYDSLTAMDMGNDRAGMEVIGQQDGNMEVTYFRKDDEYPFTLTSCKSISLPQVCSNITIDAPIVINIPSYTRVDMETPIYINCEQINFGAKELSLNSYDAKGNITWEIECLNIIHTSGGNPQILNYISQTGTRFQVMSTSPLVYPFTQYQVQNVDAEAAVEYNKEYYHKLRRTLILFRSHSKGELARLRDKIDNCTGNSPVGKAIIKKLLETGVMFERGRMYVINYEKFAEVLGLKYDNIQSSIKNEKVAKFLKSAEEGLG